MIARPIEKSSKWCARDGKDFIHIWVSVDGIKVQRFSQAEDRQIAHCVHTIKHEAIVTTAEGQPLLPL